VWQANVGPLPPRQRQLAGHPRPQLSGGGRAVTDADGTYRFVTIRPGAYPGAITTFRRPAHIHFAVRPVALAAARDQILPDDPLFFQDPILRSIPTTRPAGGSYRHDHDVTEPEWALGRFDIVLRGPDATPFETSGDA
jgi:protocatechuate 3,4-dioxygenase beta subunit